MIRAKNDASAAGVARVGIYKSAARDGKFMMSSRLLSNGERSGAMSRSSNSSSVRRTRSKTRSLNSCGGAAPEPPKRPSSSYQLRRVARASAKRIHATFQSACYRRCDRCAPPCLALLEDFEDSDRPASEHDARIRLGYVDDEDVQRVPIFGLCRGDEAPPLGASQA